MAVLAIVGLRWIWRESTRNEYTKTVVATTRVTGEDYMEQESTHKVAHIYYFNYEFEAEGRTVIGHSSSTGEPPPHKIRIEYEPGNPENNREMGTTRLSDYFGPAALFAIIAFFGWVIVRFCVESFTELAGHLRRGPHVSRGIWTRSAGTALSILACIVDSLLGAIVGLEVTRKSLPISGGLVLLLVLVGVGGYIGLPVILARDGDGEAG